MRFIFDRRDHRQLFRILLAVVSVALLSQPDLSAHGTGENYIFLSISKEGVVDGRFEFRSNDLKEKLGIDIMAEDSDAIVENVRRSAGKVHPYILENFSVRADGAPVAIEFTEQGILSESGKFAQYRFRAKLPELPDILTFRHQMMYENDRFHRALLVLSYNPVTDTEYGEEKVAIIFNRTEAEQHLDLREPIPDLLKPPDFLWQGILHIWIGIDHILFLVVLLLPAVLRYEGGERVPAKSFLRATFEVVKIVTIFTVAHSITLGLAALGFVNLPGRLVESAIALSIILVAVNNIFLRLRGGSAVIIFVFGLFHGLGFASVMGEIPFRMQDLVKVLIYFNVGVEIGQLAIVAGAFAVLYPLRKASFYKPLFLVGGSALAGLVALYWFVERAFEL